MRIISSSCLLVFIISALQPFTTCAEIYELQAVVGESLDVNCSPDETYEFWTDWKLTEVEVIPGEGFRIPKVTADLDGQYFRCHLQFNGVRYENYTVWRLNVSVSIPSTTPASLSDTTTSPPESVTGGEGLRVNVSQSATLSCHVDGYPLSSFTWVKIDGPEQSKPSGIQELLYLNPSNTSVEMSLSFTRVTREDNGTYECKAMNHNETFTSQTSLIVTEKPDVEIRGIGAISSDTIYMKWIIHNWNEPVKRYHIQLMKEGAEKWENYPEEFDKESSTKFEIEGLEKGARYQFRITVENAIGASKPAYSRWVQLPKEDAKVESFDPKPEVERTSNTSVRLRWSSPPESLEELIGHFNLSAILEGKVDKTEKIFTNQTTYEFRGLIAGAEYPITVSACNNYTNNCTENSKASEKDAESIPRTTSASFSDKATSPPESVTEEVRDSLT